ncbi:hypothetical protein LguiB_024775 [Lonicera macranthoides]
MADQHHYQQQQPPPPSQPHQPPRVLRPISIPPFLSAFPFSSTTPLPAVDLELPRSNPDTWPATATNRDHHRSLLLFSTTIESEIFSEFASRIKAPVKFAEDSE